MRSLIVVTNSDSFSFDLEFLRSVCNFSVWKEVNCFSEYKTGKTELSQNEVRWGKLLSYCHTLPSVTHLDVCSPYTVQEKKCCEVCTKAHIVTEHT